MPKLTPKQAAFVREYAVNRNATQAAISAGYSGRTAASIGNENLMKPEIKAAIEALEQEHATRCEVTIDTITAQLLEDRTLARTNNQASAAVAASMGLAKLHGLIVDRASLNLNAKPHEEWLKDLDGNGTGD